MLVPGDGDTQACVRYAQPRQARLVRRTDGYGYFTLLEWCVSSLRRGHANILCIVPILTDDPRRESKMATAIFVLNICILKISEASLLLAAAAADGRAPCVSFVGGVATYIYIYIYIYIYTCMI